MTEIPLAGGDRFRKPRMSPAGFGLAAAALEFCAQPEAWPVFAEWARGNSPAQVPASREDALATAADLCNFTGDLYMGARHVT